MVVDGSTTSSANGRTKKATSPQLTDVRTKKATPPQLTDVWTNNPTSIGIKKRDSGDGRRHVRSVSDSSLLNRALDAEHCTVNALMYRKGQRGKGELTLTPKHDDDVELMAQTVSSCWIV